MSLNLLPSRIGKKFEVAETHHAASILSTDFPAEWDDVVGMLSDFVLRRSDVVIPGGRKSPMNLLKNSVGILKAPGNGDVQGSPTYKQSLLRHPRRSAFRSIPDHPAFSTSSYIKGYRSLFL